MTRTFDVITFCRVFGFERNGFQVEDISKLHLTVINKFEFTKFFERTTKFIASFQKLRIVGLFAANEVTQKD